MFENHLNQDEKKTLLKVLSYLATVDGVRQEEMDLISVIGTGLHVDSSHILEEIEGQDLQSILSEINEMKTKNIFLAELINLGHIDGDYSSNEKEGVREIAKVLSVAESKVNELEAWIEQGLVQQNVWLDDGLKLISE